MHEGRRINKYCLGGINVKTKMYEMAFKFYRYAVWSVRNEQTKNLSRLKGEFSAILPFWAKDVGGFVFFTILWEHWIE